MRSEASPNAALTAALDASTAQYRDRRVGPQGVLVCSIHCVPQVVAGVSIGPTTARAATRLRPWAPGGAELSHNSQGAEPPNYHPATCRPHHDALHCQPRIEPNF